MICPVCGTYIDDGSIVCRACHARITVVRAGKREPWRWCSSCGVRLGWADEICPHCGLPQERVRTTISLSSVPEVGTADDTDEFLAGFEDEVTGESEAELFESAIPAERDPASKVEAQDEMPERRSVVLSLFLSLVVMGGLVMLITHPWSPGTKLIGATEEADTTMVGFPGTVEELSGQDNVGVPGEPLEGDDATFAQLTEAYAKLMRYQERADGNAAQLDQARSTGSLSELTSGRRACEALAVDVRNILAKLAEIDVSSGTYTDDLAHLEKLGEWLQKRVDALTSAWEEAEGTSGATARDDAGAQDQDTYKVLFDRRSGEWEPKKK